MVLETAHIIFCLSYLNVPWTCQLIEKRGAENVTVISNIANIIKLIAELYPEAGVMLTKNGNLMPFSLFKQKIFFKKKLDTLVNKNVYFSFVAYGIMETYAIRILSRKNKIFYKKSVDIQHLKKARSIKSKLWTNYLRSTLGVKFNPRLIDGNLVFAVADEFLAQVNARDFEIPDNVETVKTRIAEKYNLSNKKVLFCVGGIVEDGLIAEEEYVQKNDSLIDTLCRSFKSSQISLKMHPRFNNLYSKEKKLQTISKHVPASLIIDHYDIVIGYSSAILFEAANMGKKVFSTLDFFTPINEKTKKQYIEYLQSNLFRGNMIPYFSELGELERFFNT